MIDKAQQFEKCERTVRQLFADLMPLSEGYPEMYDIMSKVAEIAKAIHENVKKQIEDEDVQTLLSIGAEI